jgi:hypothetical protein
MVLERGTRFCGLRPGNASAFSADPRLRLATWPVRHCYIACASFSLLNLGRDVRLIRGVNFSTLCRLTSQSTTRMTQKSLILNCKAISELCNPVLVSRRVKAAGERREREAARQQSFARAPVSQPRFRCGSLIRFSNRSTIAHNSCIFVREPRGSQSDGRSRIGGEGCALEVTRLTKLIGREAPHADLL